MKPKALSDDEIALLRGVDRRGKRNRWKAMSDSTTTTRFRFWLWLIRVIGVIVPRRLRTGWRQEWEAELRYREARLAEWDRLDWRHKLDLLWRSTSAFWDALWMQTYRYEDAMIQDFRFGVRMLLKHKAVTAVSVLSLALGIGANTAIFSVVDALMLILAVLLACLGLYGVISYTMARRTSEIGIRLALGATPAEVLAMVLKESLLLVLAGIAIGVPAALVCTRFISTVLFGVGAIDPLTLGSAGFLILAVATVAALLPARRASRVDPMVALRYE